MKRFLLFVFVAWVAGHQAFADDGIKWGQPVNGLRIGIESPVTSTTSDQDLTFTVTAENTSSQPITLPTPDTYLLKSGRDDDFHETPLMPVLERSGTLYGVVTMATSSPIGPDVSSLQPHIVTLAPGQSVTWNNVPLGRSFYSPGPMIAPWNKAVIEKSTLQPDSLYHIRFRFENDQALVANQPVWTGQVDSGVIDLHISAPSLAGIKVSGRFSLPKPTYFLGDPIEATFTVTNHGDTPILFPTGGDYRATGRHDRFSIHAVDSWGWSVTDPMWWKRLFPAMGGGLGSMTKLNLDESYTEKVLINQWCDFSRAGKYKITCKRTLNVSLYQEHDPHSISIYSKPESSLPAVPIETTLEVTIEDKPSVIWTSVKSLYSWWFSSGQTAPSQTAGLPPQKPTSTPPITKEEREAAHEKSTKLIKAMQTRDEATALPLAQEILQHDPLEKGPLRGLRHEALGALREFGKFDAYLEDINRQLQADPDSLRLNLLAAEAYQALNGRSGKKPVALAPWTTPGWLKLVRKGDTFTASYSTDGQKWTDVFTQDVKMDAAGLAGLIASPNSVAHGQVVWKKVQVNGVSMTASGLPDTAPLSSSLPSPWQYSDVGLGFHAGAQWDGTQLKMDSPLSKRQPAFFFEDYGYVHHPIDGDAEIVACLDSLTAPDDGSWAGLCFRSRTDDASPSVEFFCDHLHQAHFSVHSNGEDESIRLYKKAAGLASGDPNALAMISMALRSERQFDEANVIEASRLTADFPKDSIKIMDALPVFENADQLSNFVRTIEDGNPYDSSLQKTLVRIGDDLQLTQHPEEAERVYRKALSMSVGPLAKQDTVPSLVRLLIENGQQDDAAAQFEKGFMGRDSSSWMPTLSHPPDLIFMSGAWYKTSDDHPFAEIDDRTIPQLEMAVSLGLYSKLKQQLDERGASSTLTPLIPVDPSRLASILLSIIARDPAYRPELDKLLDELPSLSLPGNASQQDGRTFMAASGINGKALLLICEQLARWPEERLNALRVAKTDFHGAVDGLADNYVFRNQAEFEIARISASLGDRQTAQEALRYIVSNLHDHRAQNPGGWPLNWEGVIRDLIANNMFDEAAEMLADAQSDPQMAHDAGLKQRIDREQAGLAFAQGQTKPDGLIYGLTMPSGQTAADKPVFFWQINAGETGNDVYPAEVATHPSHAHVYLSDVLWIDAVPIRSTDYRIEVQGGPDKDHLTHVATYENVATRGNAPIEIPAGTRFLQASLFPATSEAPAIAIGHALVWSDSENLLKNPRFEVSKNAQGMAEIAGWHGLLSANVTQATGGPLPSGHYQYVEVPNYRIDLSTFEVSSDAIPLKPGTDYLLSAWQRDGMAPRFLFLNANGTELRSPHSASAERHDGWQWCAWRLTHSSPGDTNDIHIPPGAVSVQILFGHSWKVADVSFRALPDSVGPK